MKKTSLFLLTLLFLIACQSVFADAIESSDKKAIHFSVEATSIDLENTQLSLTQVEQSIRETKENLRDYQEQLQALSLNKPDPELNFRKKILSTKIENQTAFLKLNIARRETLRDTLKALNDQLTTEQTALAEFTKTEAQKAKLNHELQVKKAIQTLSDEQNYWLKKITSLNQNLGNNKTQIHSTYYQKLLQQIFTAEESSNITQFKISLLQTGNSIQNLSSNLSDTNSATELYGERQALSDDLDNLQQIQEVLANKTDLLQKRMALLTKESEKAEIQSLLTQYQSLSQNLTDLLSQATNAQEKANTLLAKALAHRQGLPGFHAEEWLLLFKSLSQMLVMTYQLAIVSFRDAANNFQQLSPFKAIKLFATPILALTFYGLIRLATRKIKEKLSTTPDNLLHRFLDAVLRIFMAHLWLIILLFGGDIFLNLLNISSQTTNLFFHLGNTILIYSIALMSAKISLYENATTSSGDDVKLYHRLCWLFSFGFIIAFFMILSSGLNSPYETQDLFNRLFMAFVLIIALMLLKAWRVLPETIISSINPQRNYLIRSIRILGFIIPLIILSNAAVGLIGFVELAWTISKYEGIFLLLATSYFIARGLMNDAINLLSEKLVRLRSGWIITEAFVNPIARWFHIFLALAFLYLLLYCYELNHQVFLVNYFHKALHLPIVRFSSHVVTLWILVKAIIVGWIAIWATKWSREFFYRRLYRNVRDSGARNSLAIFSQYGVFVLGAIFTLKTLQIDLTALGYILSGFALGAGFGLRDLANNFVSGLLILIERPMRRGDTVTIGDYEGKVLNIGIRATNLLSSDNREIVVPNSEVFSKIFTNWTHRDDIIRCETPVKLRWENDPHDLAKMIEQVILSTKDVLKTPAPQAILRNINDGLLEFILRFYIDYHITDSRVGMQSRVLFNLWDKLSELGIKPAYPTQRIFLKKEDEN